METCNTDFTCSTGVETMQNLMKYIQGGVLYSSIPRMSSSAAVLS